MAGTCLAVWICTSAAVRAADEPYDPTPDTGPHDPLVPKNSVPEPENAMAIVAVTAVALLGGVRFIRVLRTGK